jgi:TPR repeat protein
MYIFSSFCPSCALLRRLVAGFLAHLKANSWLFPGFVPDSRCEAARWFQKAVGQGYPLAQFNLGAMHQNGNGVKQDPKEAAKWFQKAAGHEKSGYAQDQCNTGIMYFEGQGVLESSRTPKGRRSGFRKQRGMKSRDMHKLNATPKKILTENKLT